MTRICRLTTLAALLVGAVTAPAHAADGDDNVPCEKVESIGAATMGDDRVISMRIRSLPPRVAEMQSKSGPHSKDYADLFVHLGGIVPGQTKFVKPWCD